MAQKTTTVATVAKAILESGALKDSEKKTLESLAPQPKVSFDTLICISLSLRKPGNKKKTDNKKIAVVKSEDQETHEIDLDLEADKDLLSVSKEVWSSEAFKKIRVLDVTLRSYIKEQTVPAPSVLKDGVYVIPPEIAVEVDEEIQDFFKKREALVTEFAAEYPQMMIDAEARLGSLFNEADYPPVETLVKEFTHDVSYIQFGTANALSKIAPAIFKREEQKAKAKLNEFIEQTEAALLAGTQKIVADMLAKLSEPGEGGKKKQVRAAAVDNWKQFFLKLKDRNLTGHSGLAEIAEKGMKALEGVSKEDLAKSDLAKANLAKAFEEIRPLIDKSITDQPIRKFKLADDED